MSSARSRIIVGLFAGGAACGAAHADRPQYGAFLNIQQIAEAQLHGPGADDVTYTEVSGNLFAQISNRRIVATGTYRLGYRIPEIGDADKSVTQDGVMRLQANVIDEWLTVDAGAIITRSRVDPSGSAPATNVGNPKNLTQTYSTFFQPSLFHRIGDLGVQASYRYAYTQNEIGQTDTGSFGPPTDRFDSSVSQQASLALAMQSGDLPFDWKLSGQYQHENTTNLAQHLRAASVTGEIKLPIASSRVALVASGGYERTRTTQRKALVDPITGFPVLGKGGKFVVDPASPRVLTYEMDGLIGDAGIIWRPSRRTRVEARAGYRYGGLSMTGLIELQPSARSGLTFILTDQVQTFGSGVSGGLAGSTPDLDLGQSNDPSSSYQECLFGKQAGNGKCIGGALGNASARSYRERAANLIFTRRMRTWTFGGSLGYSRRTYFDDPTSPVSLAGVVDQSFFGNLSIGQRLTRTSSASFSFSGNYFMNGQVGASDVMSGSFSTNYIRSFGRGIQMQATVAVDGTKQENATADVSGRAQLGLQYKF
ncbi:hypothetical protein [Rhizorhabdus dicambivorans]|uniref:Preprotein translocase subunit YajC n=1 Tax=Rhizorhabdus dicambivorans TaxID=1850238 RepID=A0A2A4FWV7_9SPHN|nr:hypothetical protein [Rhizorhabdus dicambivorans]ATE64062.1 hypothetical protein CMV14_06375 [Rhizorhabdus dicambivorans]PCE42665.1 hypothetical protein COO09_09700 [Rhizorhabdus dicambivorans]